jgi:predicted transcriptional regulator
MHRLVLLQKIPGERLIVACIDKDGNITRSAELMLLAAVEPNDIETIIRECGLAPFRVRSGLRELEKVGLIQMKGNFYQVTPMGIEKLEGKLSH